MLFPRYLISIIAFLQYVLGYFVDSFAIPIAKVITRVVSKCTFGMLTASFNLATDFPSDPAMASIGLLEKN